MFERYRRYLIMETIASIIVNTLFSALFMALVFGHSASIDLWGVHGLAVDFIPQTLMISAMSILVPTLLTRRRVRRGIIDRWSAVHVPGALSNLAVRVGMLGTLFTLAMGGAALALLAVNWTGPMSFWHVFPWKLIYGASVALAATPLGLVLALGEQ